ncbi:MAG: 2-hydroxychromene-2-carboxylate isomerase [Parvularcula sp.]|jgi:2-hydroxychromene-2-carboxylate isomerase|nr:2-hydroxychromene-2-carboxylate isomerase [Parvularcula sp.]
MATFYFDYASPNAYLSWRALPSLEKRAGAVFERVPVLLGGIFKATNNQSPFFTFAGVKGRLDYERLEMNRFVEEHGLREFAFNPHFPQNSLQMMRGAVAARRLGVGEAYDAACFKGMWEDGLKLDDGQVFRDRLVSHGLDADVITEACQDPEIKAALIAQTEEAVARGVFGLPSFIVNGELYFGKDRLSAAERALRS